MVGMAKGRLPVIQAWQYIKVWGLERFGMYLAVSDLTSSLGNGTSGSCGGLEVEISDYQHQELSWLTGRFVQRFGEAGEADGIWLGSVTTKSMNCKTYSNT